MFLVIFTSGDRRKERTRVVRRASVVGGGAREMERKSERAKERKSERVLRRRLGVSAASLGLADVIDEIAIARGVAL